MREDGSLHMSIQNKNKHIPKPRTTGVVKVPVVMQLEALECGAASLEGIRPPAKYRKADQRSRRERGRIGRDPAAVPEQRLSKAGKGQAFAGTAPDSYGTA